MNPDFKPTADTAALIDLLLDHFELRRGQPKRAVRIALHEVTACLPGYGK